MKTIICSALVPFGLALLALGVPAFGQPPPKRVCIYTHDIKNSEPSKDERSITFVMRNGERWRNDLMGRCTGLKYDGFTWVLRDGDQVCDNSQTLTVNTTGNVCMPGKFTQLPKPAPKVN
jgi:hypothetical protein